MASQNDTSSTAVERTLLILEAAAQREGGMSNAEFSRKLKIPKSSASYILRTLEHHGYLRRDGDGGRYRLGMMTASIRVAPRDPPSAEATPTERPLFFEHR